LKRVNSAAGLAGLTVFDWALETLIISFGERC
jgi:hypothetical protein